MNKYIVLAAFWLAATSAQGGELAALSAESIDIGGFHGIVYYTSEHDGYRVVATIAEGETGSPVRFVAMLKDGDVLAISAPGKLGEASQVLEISRAAGRLVVGPPPTANELVIANPQVVRE
jgi:hypothetical protein